MYTCNPRGHGKQGSRRRMQPLYNITQPSPRAIASAEGIVKTRHSPKFSHDAFPTNTGVCVKEKTRQLLPSHDCERRSINHPRDKRALPSWRF